MNESALDIKKTWYFGNNRSKNLKISPPRWSAPFFLTTNIEYADEYSDYGVYKIDLKSEARSRILDFNKSTDVKKLKWPKVLIDKIREGKNDLNSIAYDMYILAYSTGDSLMYIEDNAQWTQAAEHFKKKSKNIFVNVDITSSVWGSEKDHQFLLQMWKDIYDAGFDGFMHVEFGSEVLAIFTFQCIDQISVKPVSQSLNEKMKNRALKKAFKAKGQAAFPDIKSDDDIVFVSDIPKEKALKLLKRACHDVSNFHPEYMEKAVKWSDDYIFGVFNKHDKRNVLAMASISYNGDKSGAAYLHEMTGFIKGGYGKKLVMWLLHKFKKVYGQIALEGSGTKDDPYKPNEKLRDKFYAAIPGVKIYRVENSIWDCPADFFYYGISNESIKEFLEKTYSSKEHNTIDESKQTYLQKYRDEVDAKKVVDAFWQIKSRLSAPQNDIDWWIKKPFQALKDFVQSFDMSNKRQRRDAEYRREMVDNDAKMLGSKDGYEIWYVPAYEAMRTIGRFYKGISTTWCVASDDPSFWFDMHDMSEFIVLVRENPQNDEFDKIAIEMQNGGRRFDVDDFVMWDAENEDDRFCNDDLMHYAWELFVQNGERRGGL